MAGQEQVGGQELDPDVAEFMVRRLRIFQTEAGNATVGSGDWHGDGDGDDTGLRYIYFHCTIKEFTLRAFYSIWIGRAVVFLSQQK